MSYFSWVGKIDLRFGAVAHLLKWADVTLEGVYTRKKGLGAGL